MQILAMMAVLGSAAAPGCDMDRARETIIAAHKEIIRAHKESDVEAWLAVEDDELILGGRGRIYRQDRETRRQGRTVYLSHAQFDVYEDMIDPIAEVSTDCSLGWVMVQVRAKGETDESGGVEPIEWQSSWVELYRNGDNGWRLVGAVSNFAP